jgi:conjugative relaxase-like TrwC/TraI family protein
MAMLSVAKLAPGQEAYYERSVARGVDDYYAGRGEAAGVWWGAGAATLGLAGTLGDGDLGALISGVDPASGTRLRRHYPPRSWRVTRLDPDTGQDVTVERRSEPVAGFDLVFSVPKSASVLWALGDDRVRGEVLEAHEAAWQEAGRYLEREACVTRSGRNGVHREAAGGFVAAAFRHRTSRAQDPHLHTHLVVANVAQGADGRWRALEGNAILRTHRLAAGYLYEAHVRYELSRRLGVEWDAPVKGMGEIRGISREVLEAFSTRRAEIVAHQAESDTYGWRAGQVAALVTRERKRAVDLDELRRGWSQRAAELGFDRVELDGVLDRTAWVEPSDRELERARFELVGPTGLTEKRRTFSSPDAVKAWSASFANGLPASVVLDRADDTAARAALVEASPGAGVPARFTTHDLVRLERRALEIIRDGRRRSCPVARIAAVTAAIEQQPVVLSQEQRAMVLHACASPERVVCVVGHSGAGKTTATRAIHDAYRASGVPIIGCAPSAVAAQKLEQETGLASSTIHGLLASIGRYEGLPEGVVVVLDEAAMAETRVLSPLLERVAEAHGKLVLIGDPAQLPSVGAGGLFAAIVEETGAAELAKNRRQHDPAERDALATIRDGHAHEYLRWSAANRRLHILDDPAGLHERVVADWWRSAAQDDLAGTVMIAYRRSDVAALNTLARLRMRAAGRLGDAEVATVNGPIAIGDRVILLRNDSALGVRNGERGTVTAINGAGSLVLRLDDGLQRTVDGGYVEAGHVRHGYALTGHATQGLTVDRAFVLAREGGAQQEWAYVAASRARDRTEVYLAADPAASIDRVEAADRLATSTERSARERTFHAPSSSRGIEL